MITQAKAMLSTETRTESEQNTSVRGFYCSRSERGTRSNVLDSSKLEKYTKNPHAEVDRVRTNEEHVEKCDSENDTRPKSSPDRAVRKIDIRRT
jgi:hypothetical protein